MAAPVDGFYLPTTCAVSGDAIPYCIDSAQVGKLLTLLNDDQTPDKTTMLRQLMYLRQVVEAETAKAGWFRCQLGSVAGGRVFMWFPLDLRHADGLLTVGFFGRMIELYHAVARGDAAVASEIAEDILR